MNTETQRHRGRKTQRANSFFNEILPLHVSLRFLPPRLCASAFKFILLILPVVGLALEARGADNFAGQVDLSKFEKVTVQHQMTLKTFDSFSRQVLTEITGKASLDGNTATFTVLDMMFRPEAYQEKDVVKIKHLPVRQELSEELIRTKVLTPAEGEKLLKSGLISLKTWQRPETLNFLRKLIAADNRKSEAVGQRERWKNCSAGVSCC